MAMFSQFNLRGDGVLDQPGLTATNRVTTADPVDRSLERGLLSVNEAVEHQVLSTFLIGRDLVRFIQPHSSWKLIKGF